MTPEFRPLGEIEREMRALRLARAEGTAPFGSAARLVALEEEHEATAAIACMRCRGAGVYTGPAALNESRRALVPIADRPPCRGCRGTGARLATTR